MLFSLLGQEYSIAGQHQMSILSDRQLQQHLEDRSYQQHKLRKLPHQQRLNQLLGIVSEFNLQDSNNLLAHKELHHLYQNLLYRKNQLRH